MGKNKELGLPFGEGMEKVAICFDVDGTLIDEDFHRIDETANILEMFLWQKWKNVDIIVWSGGGADYARTQAERILPPSLQHLVKYYSKLQYKELRTKYTKLVILDDIQDTRLGDANLIVRNK